MKIIMHSREIDLFREFISLSSSYYEFGMGGSTCLAAELVRDRVHAVDSDPVWVENVRKEIGTLDKDIQLNVVNVGPTGSWGTPIGREHEHLFEDYSLSITRTGFTEYDFCLVDGRFRVACFLQAFSIMPSDSIIAIHDYSPRPQYHIIEEFARPIAGTDQLRLFVRRPGVDMNAATSMLERCRRNPE